ncbi:sulfotransferase domain-containing protein [Fulvivirga ulvae]|uniref:sulfotransferase domain-containing protein n=1 Tax=Fulvivirga ulvae TaxID=2904245 RepID=UPI001F46159A|nr:sulfotransferase domain-containing protein [Fulvivirga ulvae]UII31662.1 sulfotransferase domain-containing protein [Fulvivirga ulvae]
MHIHRVAIHSVPRSGSSWFGALMDAHPEIIYKYQPLFSYAFKGFLSESSEEKDIIDFFNSISITKDDFLDQLESKNKGLVTEFLKTEPKAIVYKEVRYHHILKNMLERDKEVRVIGLIRNPLAVIYSWWTAPKEFKRELGWNFENEWLEAPSKNLNRKEEFNGYQKWKEVAILFNNLKVMFPDRFLLVKYSDLLHETEHVVNSVMKFIGLNIDIQQLDFIKASKGRHTTDAYGVFKKKPDDFEWVGRLPDSMVEYIKNDLDKTKLKEYLDQ